MDLMQEHDDDLNRKVILLSVGSAAVAALLAALIRRKEDETPVPRVESLAAQVEDVIAETKKESKKAAKAAKKKRKEIAAAAAESGRQVADDVRDATEQLSADARAAERDLKAAAWDAQQEAKEAESRLRAAGHRVVDDATHLASWVGAEARSLAGEGKERLTQLRHREDEGTVEREVERLRAEIDELKELLRETGQRVDKEASGLTSRFTGKSGPIAEVVASEAVAAALGQIERALRAKAPALLAARNKTQVAEILQKELGSTLRDTAVQAAVAALGKLDLTRGSSKAVDDAEDHARAAENEIRDRSRGLASEVAEQLERAAEDARDTADEAMHRVETIQANGKRRFWRTSHDASADLSHAAAVADSTDEETETVAKEDAAGEEHRGKAGLFWAGAGIGLALYALLDAERRDQVLRLANEASVQVQELVRDLQGYDDEF
jgi:hypothetical protein